MYRYMYPRNKFIPGIFLLDDHSLEAIFESNFTKKILKIWKIRKKILNHIVIVISGHDIIRKI